ncbi:oligopeptide ABC transporter ATP-binding protein [Aureimonas sp. SA4125]|uniref:ABC transporter ATP-binding protein n=1 Tax=Aureimonas sp. SA4125 TaxID=2826993 RepID=UPI001CC44718|nr:oligopeptide/dipeptide ABC transporter ATP-binding protein [Aureimonas sp. SA4125]BDA83153.1 oligopeptide ABC transporter ATP-binding protein [Aureimonas sp. SA4125]
MAVQAPILETVSLVKHFGGKRQLFSRSPLVQAVGGVSLKVMNGETFAIVGESGCGKSTLGRLMIRLLEPTSGDVIYAGRNLGSLTKAEMRGLRRELQIVFQDPFASLNPQMSVTDIVGEPLWLHGIGDKSERRDRVMEIFRTVGLRPDMADRYPHEFSGGQRQRIGIARALAGEPKLILGDEPVSALDVSIQAQIVNLLEELKERLKLTLIIVAHDLAVIRHMSDRVAVMYLGEVVEIAATDALFDTPLHPYSQALLDAIPVAAAGPPRQRTPLQGDVPSPTKPPPGCRFHTRCPHARPLCREARPILETPADQGGRQVACHFWREIQAAGGTPKLSPPSNPVLAQRLGLYRARQGGHAGLISDTTSTEKEPA